MNPSKHYVEAAGRSSSLKPQASSLIGCCLFLLAAAPVFGATPILTDFSLTYSYTCGPRYFRLHGADIEMNATIKLVQAGQPDIVGAIEINYMATGEGDYLWGYFDLSDGTAGGFWSVTAINPGGESATITDVLEVVPDCPRGAAGDLYVCNGKMNNILQYDGLTRKFVCIFAGATQWGGDTAFGSPGWLAWAPNGNLLVAGRTPFGAPTNEAIVVECDGNTGEFVGYGVPPSANGDNPDFRSMTFGGPEGNLYILAMIDGDPGHVLAKIYDPVTWAFIEDGVRVAPPMRDCTHGRFAANGSYLVTGRTTGSPLPTFREYDGVTFAVLNEYLDVSGNKGVVESPEGLFYDVVEDVLDRVDRYSANPFVLLGALIPPSPCRLGPVTDPCFFEAMKDPFDLAYTPDGHLLVSDRLTPVPDPRPGSGYVLHGAIHEFDPATGGQLGMIGKLDFWDGKPPDVERLWRPYGMAFKPMPGDYASAGGAFSGDWVVDLADCAKLAENMLGPGLRPTNPHALLSFDQDRDGDLDLKDYAAFQRAFGSSMQTNVGACCLPDGTCIDDVWLPQCTGGAVFQGDGTTCGEITCPPTGACCLPDGICEELTDAGCDYGDGFNPGVYQGDYTTCAGVTCPFGACCFASGECAETLVTLCDGTYQGDETTCASVTCPEPCGEFTCDFDEGEPWCPTGDDSYNGGCNSDPPVFQPIACGDTVCGTAWAEDYQRDLDWYELVVTETTQLTWTVTAEFPINANAWIMDGNAGCDGYSSIAFATGAACETITLSAPVVAGTYWLLVGPASFEGVPCDTGPWEYTATVTCGPVLGAYSNTIDPMTSVALAGAGLQIADDMTLEGAGARDLIFLDLRVYGNGGGDFDVTVELWTDCPGTGGTLIPGTTFSWTAVPDDGFVYILAVDPLSPAVTIPDTTWMVADFSTPEATWIIAEQAELGFTADLYGHNDPPWVCNYYWGGDPYAGLWANLECVEAGGKARGDDDGTRLSIERIETPLSIEAVE